MSSIIQNKFHEIIGDGARLTKFNFVLPPVSGAAEWMDHIIYAVKSLTLPTMEHTPFEFRHKGLPIPIRGVTKFSQNFSVTFYLSETHLAKRFFEEWMAMIEQRHYYYNPRKEAQYQRIISGLAPEKPPYLTWYNVTAYIEQYDFDGMKPTAIYEIFNVYPTRVEAPSYSYDSVGQVAEFTVTFACSHFKLHSKGMNKGQLQNQLMHTLDKDSVLGDYAQRGPGQSYVRAEGEYWWDPDRYALFNSFLSSADVGLEQTESRRQEIYWRPYELARWDNMWNRWRETQEGVNTNPAYDRKLPEFNYDELEEKRDPVDLIVRRKYKPISGDFGYNGKI